jgi:alcohol dehydrogenase
LFLADILPTSFEVGVLNGGVQPGDTVAIVGARPIGLAAIMTAKLYTPGRIVAIDLAAARLEKALEFGADVVIDNGAEDAVERVMALTGGLGADVAIEAVGVPETFEYAPTWCARAATLPASACTATRRDVTIMTGLVDMFSTPRLLELIANGRLDATPFATHRFPLGETMAAYDTFAAAAETNALKVVLEAESTRQDLLEHERAAIGA